MDEMILCVGCDLKQCGAGRDQGHRQNNFP